MEYNIPKFSDGVDTLWKNDDWIFQPENVGDGGNGGQYHPRFNIFFCNLVQ